MSITEDQRIAILVYREDHPDAHPPEISEATGIPYGEVVHALREYEASRTRYEVKIKTEFFDRRTAGKVTSIIRNGINEVETEIVDVTSCAFKVNHGPGHQSETYCEVEGPHDIHGMEISGSWEEFDQEGNHVF